MFHPWYQNAFIVRPSLTELGINPCIPLFDFQCSELNSLLCQNFSRLSVILDGQDTLYINSKPWKKPDVLASHLMSGGWDCPT